MRRVLLTLSSLLMLVAMLATPASAAPGDTFPKIIPLPNGWRPEGIASGAGRRSMPARWRTVRSMRAISAPAKEASWCQAQAGLIAVGMYLDQRTNYLFVAGGTGGQGRVYDASTGAQLGPTVPVSARPATFINDVIVTREAAYFTNSFQACSTRVPLGARWQTACSTVGEPIPLSGECPGARCAGFNANGIEATSNGKWLVIVQQRHRQALPG